MIRGQTVPMSTSCTHPVSQQIPIYDTEDTSITATKCSQCGAKISPQFTGSKPREWLQRILLGIGIPLVTVGVLGSMASGITDPIGAFFFTLLFALPAFIISMAFGIMILKE